MPYPRLALVASLVAGTACGGSHDDSNGDEGDGVTTGEDGGSTGSGDGGGSSDDGGDGGTTDDGTTGGGTGGGCPDGLCDEMVEVPAGTFWMGCEVSGCGGNVRPRHEVYLDAFLIDKYEVTQAQYWACAEDGRCMTNPGVSCNDLLFEQAEPNHPMFCMSYEAAKDYCEENGKRLPTEAEWEKAARGTDERLYPWGDDPPTCDLANYRPAPDEEGCGTGGLAPVGSRPAGASFYGALDMAGNVAEVVADWYAADYYEQSPMDNPLGPDAGSFRVGRGGTYEGASEFMRATFRGQANFGSDMGFRCAKSM